MKLWLQDNVIEMYSAHNENKSVVTIRFIKPLNNKTYKYMNSVSRNVYIDKLADTVNECNNTYRKKMKMKPSNVKSRTYIDFAEKIMKKILNVRLVTMLEYLNIKLFWQKFRL